MSDENGQQPVRLDIRTLKMGELEDIEAAVGHNIAAELATFNFSMRTLRGLLWIALRRSKPDATFEDARELDFSDIINGIEGPEEMPPEVAAPLDSDGSKPNTSGANDSTPARPNGEPATSSRSSTG